MTPEKKSCTVFFYIDGNEVTPMNLAKAIIESDVLRGKDFHEFVEYLSVHVNHQCQHGME